MSTSINCTNSRKRIALSSLREYWREKHHQEDEIYLYPPGRHSAIHWLCRSLALMMCVLRKCSLISLGISVMCRTVECKIVNGCCRKRRSPLLTELWYIPATNKQRHYIMSQVVGLLSPTTERNMC